MILVLKKIICTPGLDSLASCIDCKATYTQPFYRASL